MKAPALSIPPSPAAPPMAGEDALELASLLCSRLCHDMLSPVGALSNGLELLAEERDPAMRQRCMELHEQSARTSADKLKFFRLAFGAAGGFGDEVPAAEPQALIAALVAANTRLTLNWQVGMAMMPKPAVKVLLNLSLIGIEALVRGGTLDIAAEPRGKGVELVIRAAGPRIAFDPNVGRALAGDLPRAELSSRTAPAAMIAALAARAGGHIQIAQTPESLLLGAALPAV